MNRLAASLAILTVILVIAAVIVFRNLTTTEPATLPGASLEAEIAHIASTGFEEWTLSLLNPTGLGQAYTYPDVAVNDAVEKLNDDRDDNDLFAWWLLEHIAGPGQRSTLEPLVRDFLEAGSGDVYRRYWAIVVLIRIGSDDAIEHVRSFLEKNTPVQLKIALVRQLSWHLTPERVPVVGDLLATQETILAPGIQAEIRNQLTVYHAVAIVLEENVDDAALRRDMGIHVLSILKSQQPPAIKGYATRVRDRLGNLKTRELFMELSRKLDDPELGGKLEKAAG